MRKKPGLLDVNVLIALIDPAHEFHAPAHLWFQHNRKYGWATCPITENGCLRILSKPGYPFPGLTVARVQGILAELAGAEGHRFWPDSVSILEADRFDFAGAGRTIWKFCRASLRKGRHERAATPPSGTNTNANCVQGSGTGLPPGAHGQRVRLLSSPVLLRMGRRRISGKRRHARRIGST
jgi:hypothetical protein